jgi:hypothetical protein
MSTIRLLVGRSASSHLISAGRDPALNLAAERLVGTMGAMSVTDRAAPSDADPLLEQVLALITGRAPKDRAEPLRAFAAEYTRRMSSGELAGLSPEELAGQIEGAFRLADERRGEVAVRVFNPEPSVDGYRTEGSVVETNTGTRRSCSTR